VRWRIDVPPTPRLPLAPSSSSSSSYSALGNEIVFLGFPEISWDDVTTTATATTIGSNVDASSLFEEGFTGEFGSGAAGGAGAAAGAGGEGTDATSLRLYIVTDAQTLSCGAQRETARDLIVLDLAGAEAQGRYAEKTRGAPPAFLHSNPVCTSLAP
jgi:hypothetical protein